MDFPQSEISISRRQSWRAARHCPLDFQRTVCTTDGRASRATGRRNCAKSCWTERASPQAAVGLPGVALPDDDKGVDKFPSSLCRVLVASVWKQSGDPEIRCLPNAGPAEPKAASASRCLGRPRFCCLIKVGRSRHSRPCLPTPGRRRTFSLNKRHSRPSVPQCLMAIRTMRLRSRGVSQLHLAPASPCS